MKTLLWWCIFHVCYELRLHTLAHIRVWIYMYFPARSDDVVEECRCAICHKTQTYIGTYLQSNKSLIAATVKLYFNNTLYLFLSLLQCIASCWISIYMLRWIERYNCKCVRERLIWFVLADNPHACLLHSCLLCL